MAAETTKYLQTKIIIKNKLNKTDIKALDYVIFSSFIKIFRTKYKVVDQYSVLLLLLL